MPIFFVKVKIGLNPVSFKCSDHHVTPETVFYFGRKYG